MMVNPTEANTDLLLISYLNQKLNFDCIVVF